MTLGQATDLWIKRVELSGRNGPAERTTVNSYRQHVRLHILPRLGADTRVTKLTTPQIASSFGPVDDEAVRMPPPKDYFAGLPATVEIGPSPAVSAGPKRPRTPFSASTRATLALRA